MTKQILPNQHVPLHFLYGHDDCCLCHAQEELEKVTGQYNQLVSRLCNLTRLIMKAYPINLTYVDETQALTEVLSLAKSKWISVKEATPELFFALCNGFSWESEQVLVCGPSIRTPQLARLYANDERTRYWWWKERHGEERTGITHWMPIPDEPYFDVEGKDTWLCDNCGYLNAGPFCTHCGSRID
jgi:hypothetical protein